MDDFFELNRSCPTELIIQYNRWHRPDVVIFGPFREQSPIDNRDMNQTFRSGKRQQQGHYLGTKGTLGGNIDLQHRRNPELIKGVPNR